MARSRGLVVGISISIAAAALLVLTTDVRHVLGQLSGANLAWLLPGLAVLAVQAWVRATRWAGLLDPWAPRPVGPGRVVDAMLIGYFANAVLPGRVGEVARAIVVSRREALPFGGVAATVVIERAIDVMALAALAAVALTIAGGDAAVVFGAGAAAIAAVLGLGRWAVALGGLIPGGTPERLSAAIRAFLEAVAAIPRRSVAIAAGLSALAWTGDAMLVLLVGQALGIDIPIAGAVAIALGGALGTAVPAAPGYLATYEVGAVTLGALAGVPSEAVLPVAILTHLVGVGVLAAAGGVALGRVSNLVLSWRTIAGSRLLAGSPNLDPRS